MVEVSVIVPIYNSGKYLRKCLLSLAGQTFSKMEVILIDDGSTDLSRYICETFCKEFSSFHYYWKENGGSSDARNMGIQKSQGKYLSFVDSDDYVDKKFIEKLWKKATEEASQLVCCGYYLDRDNKKKKMCYPKSGRIGFVDFWSQILSGEEIGNFMWNKLFERQLFDEVQFPIGRKYEDKFTLYQLADRCKGISIVAEPLYYYVFREASVVNSFGKDSACDLIDAGERLCAYIRRRYPELRVQCERHMMKEHIITVNALSKAGIFRKDALWDASRDYILKNWKWRRGLQRKFLVSAWMIRIIPCLYGRIQYWRLRK